MRATRCFVQLLLPLFAAIICCSCGSSFYASESDTRAINVTMSTADAATELLAGLPSGTAASPPVQILFDASSGTPRIANVDSLRNIVSGLGDLAYFEQSNGQLNLERLAAQLADRLNAYINDRVTLFADQGGSQIKLTSLRDISAHVATPFVVTYTPASATIAFQGAVAVTVRGTIDVQLLSGVDEFVAGIFGDNPDGLSDVIVNLPSVPIAGHLQLFPSVYPVPSRVLVHVDAPSAPGPLQVDVSGGKTSDVNSGIQQLFAHQLSSPIDVDVELAFDNFVVSGLKLLADGSLTFEYHPLPAHAEYAADAVARAGDGTVLHARKRALSWSGFAAIPALSPVAGDPVVVASGNGNLEFAAVIASGGLLYSAWRDEAWTDPLTLRLPRITHRRPPQPAGEARRTPRQPEFTANSRPAVIATAPGQVEIVAVDTLAQLWHLRRVNGAWLAPARIDSGSSVAARVRDPVLVWIDQHLLLGYVDANNALYVASFDLDSERWNAPTVIPTQGVLQMPAIVACGDGRFDVVYRTTVGTARHATGALGADGSVSLGAESQIGANLSAAPSLVCSGYQQMELVGRGKDFGFYYDHYVGPASPQGSLAGVTVNAGWQGWVSQSRAFYAVPLLTPFFGGRVGPTLGVDASRTGDVQVIAPVLGTGPQLVFESRFASARFGRSAWQAVEWRGFAQLGSARFVGTPSVAISDQSLEYVCPGSGLVRVNDGGVLTHEGKVVAGADPIVLSTGPGSVDVLALYARGIVVDTRVLNGAPTTSMALAVAPSPIVSFSAVANRAGRIDVVAVSANHRLYHWMRLKGLWQGPRDVQLLVTTAPTPPGLSAPQPQHGPAERLPPTGEAPPRSSPPIPPTSAPRPSWQLVDGQVTSVPVLVGTGADQLELLATGGASFDSGDHPLFRWRFRHGAWSQPVPVDTGLTVSSEKLGRLSAAATGNGAVDVVLVDAATRAVSQVRLLPDGGLANWVPADPADPTGHLAAVGGTVTSSPSILSWSALHQTVFANGTDSLMYSADSRPTGSQNPNAVYRAGAAPRMEWGGFTPVAEASLMLGGLAQPEVRDLAVGAGGSDTSFLGRSSGARPVAFAALPTSEALLPPPQTCRPALAVH
jgi:hypothetical protein